MSIKKVFATLFTVILFVLLVGFQSAYGQGCSDESDILGLDCADASGLSSEDPRVLTIRIVNFALSLLGIIAVLIILYAGFTWMTAGGNDEKIGTAKKTLFAAVAGLIIILTAYSIMSFVLRSLCTATGSCGTQYGIL